MKITIRQRGKIWYLDQMVKGERYRAPIGAGSRAWAAGKAPELLADLMKKPKRLAGKGGGLVVGDLEEAWNEFCEKRSRVGERTRKGCFNSLVCIFGRGTRLQSLSPELIEDWQQVKVAGAEDELDEDRKLRSAVSQWNQAKAVFQVRALDFYRRKLGLKLPDHLDQLARFRLPRAPAWKYELPPRELIEATEAAAVELVGDLKMIYRLAMNAGLRSGEMLELRGNWIEWRGEVPVIAVVTREGFRPKGMDRRVPVPVSLAKDIEAAGDEWVLAPDLAWTYREDLIKRDFSDWMRSLGWDRKRFSKAAHELRKLYGSRVYKDLGPAVAQKNLGHTTMETTCRYYADIETPLIALEER